MKLKFLQLAVAAALGLGATAPAMAQKKGGDVVIAILDIDDFSEVNDALGHQQGDDHQGEGDPVDDEAGEVVLRHEAQQPGDRRVGNHARDHRADRSARRPCR